MLRYGRGDHGVGCAGDEGPGCGRGGLGGVVGGECGMLVRIVDSWGSWEYIFNCA